MRKIEEAMCAAVKERRDWKSGNTEVVNAYWCVNVYLHGNLIYREYLDGTVEFTLAGWNTVTTRSRLNALGIEVRQKNFNAIYNGEEINESKWYNK